MGDEPQKYDGLIVWVTNPNEKNVKCGLIVMGDLPKKKKCDTTSVKNRTYLAKSKGMTEEGLENLVLPDNS